MAKLDRVIESVLRENVADDAAELVGIESDEAAERIAGLSFANYLELGNAVDIEDAETAREILGTVSPIEEEVVTEVAPPGMEDWIKKRKPEFKDRYGDRWEEVLYATAWKQHNNESIEEDSYNEEKLLDKPTPTLKDLAKKHDMSLGDIGAQLAKGIKAEKEHTSDMLVAKEIALDHLNELPDYYTKLEKMEEDIVGGPDTKASQRLVKWIDKNKTSIAKDVMRFVRKSDFQQTPEQWIDQIRKEIFDTEAFQAISMRQMGSDFIDSWNAMPEYYSNLIFTHMVNKYKAFADYRKDLEEGGIKGKAPNKSKNYTRTGGNKQQYKWKITFNNGKSKTVWADSRYNATHGQISPEQHIIGIKSAKKINEADNPYAAPKASAPPTAVPPSAAASSIDALAQPNATSNEVDNEENQRKEVDDLSIGDDIEVIDISGDPTAVTVKNPRGPGETLIVQTDKGEEHMIKKLAVSGTPKLQELAENFENELDEMRAGDFESSIRKTPLYVAVFRVTRVPSWASDTVEKGDLLYWSNSKDSLITVDGGLAIGLTASAVAFEGHNRMEDVKAYANRTQKESIEEAESRISDEHMIEEELEENGWIMYIGWGRDDLDYIMYKNISINRNREYRFLRVNKETGSWTIHSSKRNDAPAVESGDAPELIHVIRGIANSTMNEARNAQNTEHSGAKKGKGGYTGRKKYAKSDSNKKRRANDKQAVNENDEFYFFVEPDGRGGGEVRSNKGDNHDYFTDIADAKAEADRLNAEFSKVDESNENSCPICMGSGDATEPDYIDPSNPDQCSYCNGTGSLKGKFDEAKWDYKQKDKGRGAGTDSPMYDGGAKNRKSRKAFRKAEKAKAHQARMRGEVDESVLSDHVKVEYTDPNGRYIIVTAGVAGYWAVGQGRYYDSFDRTSFPNLEDAMNNAEEDAMNLDEGISRIVELAGIKETSSGGATGAGAIASAPAAMNGMQSRNQSIYGKTNKKPKPKERAKESTEDGIGRNKK